MPVTPSNSPGVAQARFSTWTWKGGDWVEHPQAAAPTAGLAPAALAYDGSVRRLVLLATELGQCSTPASGSVGRPGYSPVPRPAVTPGPAHCIPPSVGRWTWDGSRWNQASALPQNLPAPAAMAALPDGSGLLLASWIATWTGHGTTWSNAGAPVPAPAGRSGYGLVADPAHHAVLLFGGRLNGLEADDTWTWDGTSWNHRAGTVPALPSPLDGHPVVLP
jgi:hypothetical protein